MVARNDLALGALRFADRELCLCECFHDWPIRTMPWPARQGKRRDWVVRARLEAHQAAQLLLSLKCLRRFEQHAPVAGEQFSDPPRPDDGVAAAHEKAVPFAAGLAEVVAAGGEVEHA